ncbi:hypothetical protein CAPTEDRAFT_209590 [Capitella teleta]|uniref:HECT-type E3 ubiquitin transferase n=1 Tax=Capitella teleta TaxID=283909 RepID=R7TAD4_CAPTE|nr:hypothetical protein CAPTEDRAFT_209590 [Capitella teleta]|eukprot:ELT87974.1 hypothetical protein CAPTEDRAFT_209590 [Capitella teleta]
MDTEMSDAESSRLNDRLQHALAQFSTFQAPTVFRQPTRRRRGHSRLSFRLVAVPHDIIYIRAPQVAAYASEGLGRANGGKALSIDAGLSASQFEEFVRGQFPALGQSSPLQSMATTSTATKAAPFFVGSPAQLSANDTAHSSPLQSMATTSTATEAAPFSVGSPVQLSANDTTDPLELIDTGTPTITFHTISRQPALVHSVNHPNSVEDILGQLRNQVQNDGRRNLVNVTRSCVIEGAFSAFRRQRFNPLQKLDVHFSREHGIDAGGPSREFFRIVSQELAESSLFWGSADSKYLRLDFEALHNGDYRIAGKILAYVAVHGGPLPIFFSSFLLRSITNGIDAMNPSINDLEDFGIRQGLEKFDHYFFVC